MSKSQEAQELRLIRKRISLTQAAMAVRLSVSQSAYEKYERAERGVPYALLAKARKLERLDENEAPPMPMRPAAKVDGIKTADRFETWIQGCWMLFSATAIWLVVRITAVELHTSFLRVGPNDEGFAIAFLLFSVIGLLLAHETWRRRCQGLPIRNQRCAT